MTYPEGQRFRHADGTLFHLRGVVDGLLILRWWSRHYCAWRYRVVHHDEIECGLFVVV